MKHVLSVGQCGFDHGLISRFIQNHFDADVASAATTGEAIQQLNAGSFDLVLVNRQFDEDGGEGLEFIRLVKSVPNLAATPIMLVTNYPSFAEQAVSLGAVPGFGKSELGTRDAVEKLRPYL